MPLPEPGASAEELASLAARIAGLEDLVAGWEAPQADLVAALKGAIEELNREAFTRLIRYLREDPACAPRLHQAIRDPFLFGVLHFHGLVKEPLEVRLERGLEEVRPMLREHGGDVELVAVRPPDTVELRLTGACHGCPASSQTLADGVERAIRAHCPEVLHIHQVSQPAPERPAQEAQVLRFISPFARAADAGWISVCALEEIPEAGLLGRAVAGREVLLYREGARVSCVDNACAHMGMPMDGGELRDGTLRCPYHGFTYLLETGECLTVPEVQLTVHAVKVAGGQVAVRLAG